MPLSMLRSVIRILICCGVLEVVVVIDLHHDAVRQAQWQGKGYAVCIDHRTREIKFRDPYPIWAKALVAAYLAEEGFLRGG